PAFLRTRAFFIRTRLTTAFGIGALWIRRTSSAFGDCLLTRPTIAAARTLTIIADRPVSAKPLLILRIRSTRPFWFVLENFLRLARGLLGQQMHQRTGD